MDQGSAVGKDNWIRDFSDHSLLYFEVQKVKIIEAEGLQGFVKELRNTMTGEWRPCWDKEKQLFGDVNIYELIHRTAQLQLS